MYQLRISPSLFGVGIVLALSIIMAGVTPAAGEQKVWRAQQIRTIDGVQCGKTEYFVSHEHQYVALYENGRHLDLPAHIGIVPTCLYWLHVHDSFVPGGVDIIHNELPNHRVYTLGAFVDIWRYWGQQMRRGTSFLDALAHDRSLHIFFNGKPWTRSYRSVPLLRHAVIYLEIGTPVVPPKPHDFSALQGFESSH
jgi:hypothetical protein